MADLDDDLEPLVTECPNCATRFRVSETQLAAADGRVRCGACLTVFQGNAHLLFESELSGPEDPDADLDDLLSDLEGRGTPDEAPELDEPELDEEELTLEPFDEPGLDELPELALDEVAVDSEPTPKVDDPPAVELAPEPQPGPEPEPQPEPDPEPEPQPEPTPPAEPEPQESAEEIAAREQAEVEALLREYDLPKRRSWLGPVVVLGLIALTVEVFVLQFDEWVREPAIRPVYEVACGVLPCTVEPLRDVSAIRSLGNDPRPDPDDPERLLIDLQFVSDAEFAQPFPTIEVQFRSRTGAPVGRESIPPERYLQGDAAGLAELAPRTPVRVTLSVSGGVGDTYIISYR